MSETSSLSDLFTRKPQAAPATSQASQPRARGIPIKGWLRQNAMKLTAIAVVVGGVALGGAGAMFVAPARDVINGETPLAAVGVADAALVSGMNALHSSFQHVVDEVQLQRGMLDKQSAKIEELTSQLAAVRDRQKELSIRLDKVAQASGHESTRLAAMDDR